MSSSTTPSAHDPNLLYTAVAKGKTILTSYANGTQNASAIATLILDRIDLGVEAKQTFVHQKYQIHYIHSAPTPAIAGGLTFLAIGTESLGRRIPFACLFDVKRHFLETFSMEEISQAGLNEFTAFDSTLRTSMTLVLSHGTEGGTGAAGVGAGGDRAREVQREIDSVKDIMSQNIERVLERGERIDLLVDKSSHLGSSSLAFRKRSQAVKRQMWWQQTRTTALIGSVVLVLVYLMVGIGCGLPLWGRCF